MASFIDNEGAQQEVKLEASIYKAALDAGLSVPQYINNKYETSDKMKQSTFSQLCASSGLLLTNNREFGMRTPTLSQVFDGTARFNAGAITKDADPSSRILFPAVILELIENKLLVDRMTDVNAFDAMIAIDQSISQDRAERPIINYTGPEGGVSRPISQLAKPEAMISFTTSDSNYKIPTFALGMEASDQALRASTLDLVTLAVGRQAEVERLARVNGYLLTLLNGDVDTGDAALSSITAQSLDALVTTAGTISHLAWVKFLFRNITKRKIDYCVTDLATYLAIENRANKPTVLTDDPTSPRVDALPTIVNKALKNVKFYIVEDTVGWPANTIMGLDSRYAFQRIRNSAAAYSAVEDFVLTKSRALRFDFAEIVFRLYDDAFDVMTLTVS